METEIGSQLGTKGVSLVGWCRDVWRVLVRIVTNSSNWRLTTFDGQILWIKSYEKIVWSFPFSLSLQTKQLISTLLVHTRLASDCGAFRALLFGKSRDRSGFTSVIFCGTSFTTWSKYTDPYVVPWWLVSPMEPEVEKCRQRCDVAFIKVNTIMHAIFKKYYLERELNKGVIESHWRWKKEGISLLISIHLF